MTGTLRLHESGALPADLLGQRLIDRLEFQELLSISRATFERWLACKRLIEPIRLSRTCHRWRLSDVLRWIESGCPAPEAKARSAKAGR